jgi:hypothetical protein
MQIKGLAICRYLEATTYWLLWSDQSNASESGMFASSSDGCLPVGVPHSAQKIASFKSGVPQLVHLSTEVPQAAQNRALSSSALPHWRQGIVAAATGKGAGRTPAAPHV